MIGTYAQIMKAIVFLEKRISLTWVHLILVHRIKSDGDFTRLGGFCLVLELHQGGSATNGATLSCQALLIIAIRFV